MTEESMKGKGSKTDDAVGIGRDSARLPLALQVANSSTRRDVVANSKGNASVLRTIAPRSKNMLEKFYGDDKIHAGALRRVERAPISAANKQAIFAYTTSLEAEGLSRLRIAKCAYHLSVIAQLMTCDFSSATKADIVQAFAAIERRGYAAWTKKDFKAICKQFFRWLRGTEGFPDEVRWLKSTLQGARRKLPEEMLTEAEIVQLVAAADNARDRALIFALYESGCRIGEIGRLQVRHVEFDDFGARLIVTGKTGMRRVRVIGASSALATWMSIHPQRRDRDAPLWIALGPPTKGQMLTYAGIGRVLRLTAERAGIRKRIHPHLFRHSRATALASKLTEAQLKEHFGWTQSSTQPATYVHLSGRNVDDALLGLYGIRTTAGSDEPALKPSRCVRCEAENACDAQFCQRCGLPFSTEIAVNAETQRREWDAVMSQLVSDPDVQSLLARKLGEMKIRLPS